MKKESLPITNGGFSLVEMLVAFSVFALFVIATTGVVSGVARNARFVATSEKASRLAEEALEVSRNLRDAAPDFAMLPDGAHGLSYAGNIWGFSGTSDSHDIFTRTVSVSTVAPNQKKIDVGVSWTEQGAAPRSLAVSTYLTNWHAVLNVGRGLTVNKIVINHGGTKVASDFGPFFAGQDEVVLGEASLLPDGTYAVSETADPEYAQTFSGDCDANGMITIEAHSTVSCTITNEEKLSYLTVNKHVINHGGGKDSFRFHVDGGFQSCRIRQHERF